MAIARRSEGVDGTDENDVVALTFPALPQYLRLARMAAADTGARAGFSVEELEDLRIAVDELTYAIISEPPTPAEVTVRYTAAPGVVEVFGACHAPGEAALSGLARTILRAVVDEYDVAADGESRTFYVTKRRHA
jgi:serine/threonine-protein kinase RsbW